MCLVINMLSGLFCVTVKINLLIKSKINYQIKMDILRTEK